MSGQPTSHADSVRMLAAATLRTGLPPVLLAIAAGAVVAGVLVGPTGVYGALVGGAAALASSLATIGMMRFSAAMPVTSVMMVALGGYVLKLTTLLLVVLVAQAMPAWHTRSLALTFLAAVLAWAGAEVVAFRRAPIPTLLLVDEGSPEPPER